MQACRRVLTVASPPQKLDPDLALLESSDDAALLADSPPEKQVMLVRSQGASLLTVCAAA